MVNAGVIIVGTEITRGFSSDTNSEFLARALIANGFNCYSIIKVPDEIETIVRAITYLSKECKVLILTGGLGSTHDDVTREAVSKATGRKLLLDGTLEKEIAELMPPGTDKKAFLRQAYLPQGAQAIRSRGGTAPGLIIDENNLLIAALPGVPREMKAMFSDVIKKLRQKFPGLAPLLQKIVKTFGASEPIIAKLIDPVIRKYNKLGFTILAGLEEVKIIVSMSAARGSKKAKELEGALREVSQALGDLVFGYNDDRLEEVVGIKLKEKKIKMAVAESCTGGQLAGRITRIPGSSDYFQGGVVAYSNLVKETVLNVSHETLEKYGAVSAQTASLMAENVRRQLFADIALAVTGIAGPGGGSPEKPVGLVFIAIADKEDIICKQYNFRGDRQVIQTIAAQTGLNLVRLYLEEKENG